MPAAYPKGAVDRSTSNKSDVRALRRTILLYTGRTLEAQEKDKRCPCRIELPPLRKRERWV
eukprot:394149-Amphidinium_carterae.3